MRIKTLVKNFSIILIRLGFLIIDECPSVDTDTYSSLLLKKHKQSLSELIRRDKNRPSVVMWSIANEPRTSKNWAEDYFSKVVQHTRKLDDSRPITMAIATPYDVIKKLKLELIKKQ